MHRSVGGLVVLGLVAVGGAVAAAVVAMHAERAVYAIPGWGVALSVALAIVTLAGCLFAAKSGQTDYAAALVATVALATFGALALFSVGLLVLALAAAVGVLAGRLQRQGGRDGLAVGGALVAGLPLPLLVVFALSGPVVSCHVDGTEGGENIFMSLAGVGGGPVVGESASSAGPGEDGGYGSGPGYAYRFACRDGALTAFDIRWR